MTGMDSRYPTSERAVEMILTLFRSVTFTAEQLDTIGKSLPPIPRFSGGNRKLVCARGHARTPNNVDAKGTCIQCKRKNSRIRRRFRHDPATMQAVIAEYKAKPCECGHPEASHDREDGTACYHANENGLCCDCSTYRGRA
jgi:hypothetical protein